MIPDSLKELLRQQYGPQSQFMTALGGNLPFTSQAVNRSGPFTQPTIPQPMNVPQNLGPFMQQAMQLAQGQPQPKQVHIAPPPMQTPPFIGPPDWLQALQGIMR